MKPIDLVRINRTLSKAVKNFKPPENLTLSEWADKYRRLSSESSAEAGPWRTSRTPYLKEPMDAFTDPKVERIVMVAASQVGKSEFELNAISYIIDQDPGSIMYIQPTLEDAQKFSRLRIAPMIRDNKRLRSKVADVKSRDGGNTILQKSFPGGMLTITGSNSASALASTPARYVIGDERDRWAASAGTEGDPWKLAEARQTTFYNRKSIEVSTPTIKGMSNIEASFAEGTQERWCPKCPHCGEFSDVTFDRIKFTFTTEKIRGKNVYNVDDDIKFSCPHCGALSSEQEIRSQPHKWIAENPDAYKKGIRSFWLSAFASPWTPWKKIVTKFLDSKDDPEKLKVVYNTLFGELWEERIDDADEEALMSRREDYGTKPDGSAVELPDGVLCLTCGVDTQDNRLEYEVVGYGLYGESWGIKKGYIMGKPDSDDVWLQFDDIIDHVYTFASGKGLRISMTCIDSGGHYTQEIYERCRERKDKRVFAIKGKGGDGVPFVTPPSRVPIKDSKKITCWLYSLGVDAGKESIMSALQVQEPGPKFCHFPKDEEKGYDAYFFSGLLSERLEQVKSRTGTKWAWVKLPGHNRNEALDCRNYANAALKIIDPDMFALEARLKGLPDKPEQPKRQELKPQKQTPVRRKNVTDQYFESW
ncbi:MAG: phage terminase large subunit family protein [Oscillospiraceae bacterium]|nr:phage terminase large subunit family protein [Oscillospiraceae bacterium]